MLSFIPDLMRSSSKPDPSVVEGDDKLSLVQLHVDLPASKQHQRVDGHHAAVPDEDATRLHFLVVNQVRAVVVANLWHREELRVLSLHCHSLATKTMSLISYRVVDRGGMNMYATIVLGHKAEFIGFGLHLHCSFAGHLVIPLRSSYLEQKDQT